MNKNKNILIFLIIFLIFNNFVFAQKFINNVDKDKKPLTGEKYIAPSSFKEFLGTINFTGDLCPSLYTNPDYKKYGSFSPVIYKIGLGFWWPNYTFFSIQPSINFYTMNFIYKEGIAYPASMEERTASSINIFLNLPFCFSLYPSKSIVQFNFGLSAALRFANIAQGLKANDLGNEGTVEEDMKNINLWFWQKLRFLYFTCSFNYFFKINPDLKIGPSVSLNFPLGPLIFKEGLQGMLISAGIKILF